MFRSRKMKRKKNERKESDGKMLMSLSSCCNNWKIIRRVYVFFMLTFTLTQSIYPSTNLCPCIYRFSHRNWNIKYWIKYFMLWYILWIICRTPGLDTVQRSHTVLTVERILSERAYKIGSAQHLSVCACLNSIHERYKLW